MKQIGPRQFRSGDVAQPHLAIGLIVASLLLLLALAWQAQRAAVTHLQTAESVLREYAMLAADEFARRAMIEIGYRGYYAYLAELQQNLLAQADVAANPTNALAAYTFVLDTDSARLQLSSPTPQGVQADALLTLAQRAADEPGSEQVFLIEHTVLAGKPQTLVVSRTGDRSRVYGFFVDRDGLAKRLRAVFDDDELLPATLAGGKVTNDYVYLHFVDNHGETLFASGAGYDPYLRIEKHLDDEYSGIFRGHVISAAIDPSVAGSLVIGGLPRSRLPLLLTLFLLTAGLLIAAIRQVRRERRVAQMRSDFVAEVSHELRTPLTQIRMFAETLLYGRARTEQDRRRAVSIINREAQRLIHLVENVLRFANGESREQALRIELQSLAPVIEQVVAEFQPLAVPASIVCELDDAAGAPVDVDAFRQILLNLLDNAVKYGPREQQIRVALARKSDRVVVSVTDEGPGIPESDQEAIWTDFRRLDRARASAVAGTGIGLSIVRSLAERHGGRAMVHNDPGGGACFTVVLPASNRSS